MTGDHQGGGPIVIDLDGTILDARKRHVLLASEILERLGVAALDGPRFWNAKRDGASTEDALRMLGHDPDIARRAHRAWVARIEHPDVLALDRPLPGATRAIERLVDRDGPPVVLTARRDRASLKSQITSLGLDGLFSDLVVVDPGRASEAKARELDRVSARGFVGDTESDHAAARTAVVPFVAVTTGMRSRRFFERWGISPIEDGLGDALGRLAPERGVEAPGSDRTA